MTFTTPLPPAAATATFKSGANNLVARLFQIEPDAQRPDLPFAVRVADVRIIRALQESPDRLRELTEAYEARQALDPKQAATAPAEEQTQQQQPPGRTPPAQPPRSGFGGRNQRNAPGQQQQQPAAPADPGSPAYIDPATGESRLQHSEVVVLFVVQLNPKLPAEGTEQGTEEAGEVAGAQ
jgi:hypothetical protein